MLCHLVLKAIDERKIITFPMVVMFFFFQTSKEERLRLPLRETCAKPDSDSRLSRIDTCVFSLAKILPHEAVADI